MVTPSERIDEAGMPGPVLTAGGAGDLPSLAPRRPEEVAFDVLHGGYMSLYQGGGIATALALIEHRELAAEAFGAVTAQRISDAADTAARTVLNLPQAKPSPGYPCALCLHEQSDHSRGCIVTNNLFGRCSCRQYRAMSVEGARAILVDLRLDAEAEEWIEGMRGVA